MAIQDWEKPAHSPAFCLGLEIPGGTVLAAYSLFTRFLRRVLRFLMGVQRRLMGLEGMLHGLFRMFVAGLVVFFSVMHRGGAMRVSRLFVEFRCALMRIVGHDVPFITPQTV